MTEPLDMPDPVPAAPETPENDAPVPPVWNLSESTGGSRGRRGCFLLLVVSIATVLVLSVVLLPSLGTPGSRESIGTPGTVAFGAPGSGCAVQNPETTFPRSATFVAAARLTRPLRAGETVTSAMTRPDGHVVTAAQTIDESVSCLYQRVAPNLEPGHYVIEYRAGTEVLARGEVTIVP